MEKSRKNKNPLRNLSLKMGKLIERLEKEKSLVWGKNLT